MTLLQTKGLSAGYNGHPIVRGLDLEVGAGEVVALLGANGAGKTTTMLTLAGELQPIDGSVLIDDIKVTSPLHQRAKNGLSFVTEERSVLMGQTVEDNLRLGRCDIPYAIQLFPEISALYKRKCGLLSGGEQQIVTLARALARRPKILLADELSLGLAPLVVQRLLRAVREAADRDGVGVLLVEQHTTQVLRVVDRAYVMRRGEVVLSGTAAEVHTRVLELEDSYIPSGTPTGNTTQQEYTV